MNNSLREHLLNATTIIKNCTCMLLDDTISNKRGERELKVIGTGIFVEFRNQHFLLSAAHVFDDFHKRNIRPRIATEEHSNMMLLLGGTIYTNITDVREKDSVDIAFMKLDLETVAIISKHYIFLKEDNLAIKHEFLMERLYVFYGFPSTISKTKYDKSFFQSIPFMHVTTPLSKDKYVEFGRLPEDNVITSYDRQNSFSLKAKTISTGPDLYGISGCGMWFIDLTNNSSGLAEPKLTAIMTDWSQQNKGYIMGTRINVFTHNMEKNLAIKKLS